MNVRFAGLVWLAVKLFLMIHVQNRLIIHIGLLKMTFSYHARLCLTSKHSVDSFCHSKLANVT